MTQHLRDPRINSWANCAFRTSLLPTPSSAQIRHGQRLMLAGSCFTEHIGAHLAQSKFEALVNPFGIVYNPLSLAQCLYRLAAAGPEFSSDDLIEHTGLWHSWQHHGSFSKPDRDETLQGINMAFGEAAAFLQKTDFLFLTFGTSDVFVLCNNGQVVANNHKMPAGTFESRRLSVEEIVESTSAALQKIKSLNPDIQVILTVSPVRHLRGGLVANQRSKAALVLACEALFVQLPYIQYFPAYELLLDDLRDYRFYADDMIHPTDMAVEYVWQFFSATFFSEKTRALCQRIGKIRAAAQHRPFHADTAEHRAFAQAQLAAIQDLRREMPTLDFAAEERYFSSF